MKNVLVICTGNSCRSIMTESLINDLGKGEYSAVSAGSSPVGYVHPKAIATLRRHGHEAKNPRSKSWNEFELQEFDLVITVCNRAANEPGPAYLGDPRKLHWSTPDPAIVQGTEEEQDIAFESAYQMLRSRVEVELL